MLMVLVLPSPTWPSRTCLSIGSEECTRGEHLNPIYYVRRTFMKKVMSVVRYGLLLVPLLSGPPELAAEITGPEETLRALVQANADKDVPTLARLMAHDADIVS